MICKNLLICFNCEKNFDLEARQPLALPDGSTICSSCFKNQPNDLENIMKTLNQNLVKGNIKLAPNKILL